MLSDFLRLARPFWTSEERGRAWATAALVAFLTLAMVWLSLILVQLAGSMFDAIQNYDFKSFLHYIEFWTAIAFVYCAIGVYQNYASMALTIRWRRWMTDHFLQRWLGDKTFYYWQIAGQSTDNPDQRISEDIRDFVGTNDGSSGAIPLISGLLSNIATLIVFAGLLWKVGGTLSLEHGRIHIPGYLVWSALLYSIIGSFWLAKLGRPIIGLSYNQQRYEADFRFGLVRLREHSDSIALSDGEAVEHQEFMGMFARVRQNYLDIMNRTKKINAFSIGYGQAASVMPYFLCSPVYFAHLMTLGGLNQSAQAFGSVQGAVSFFINSYIPIAQWRAVIRRLTDFAEAMQMANALSKGKSIPTSSLSASTSIDVHGLSLTLPNGQSMIDDLNFSLPEGGVTLISGPSGCGKSTFLRAVAGVWPYAKGHLQVPADFHPMVLPQEPYLPIGSLRAAIAYPQPAESFTDEAMREVLSRVRLIPLGDKLDESQNWGQVLSPGERQRIALARVFLHRPDWLFLDEATSALDEPTERSIYESLAENLPNTTIVSIGHRSSLKPLHDETILFAEEEVAGSGYSTK